MKIGYLENARHTNQYSGENVNIFHTQKYHLHCVLNQENRRLY